MRERERDDESGFAEGLLALHEKLRELDEPPDGHEPCVSEEPHDVGARTSRKTYRFNLPRTERMVRRFSQLLFPAPIL